MIARFVLSILIVAAIVSGSEFSNTRDAKVEKILKKLNKPALKSIKVNEIVGSHKNNYTYQFFSLNFNSCIFDNLYTESRWRYNRLRSYE